MNSQIIYLDNNATTPLAKEVIETMMDVENQGPLNPSSSHSLGRKARAYLENSRQVVADFLNVDCKEIIFTSSGTEALNLLIRGLIDPQSNDTILSSTIEHSAVLNTLKDLEKKGCHLNLLAPGTFGAIKPEQVKEAINSDIKLVVLSWVNGETGAKTDIERIADICLDKNIPLVVDGVAIMGKELFTIPKGVKGMAFSAHKFHGPKGIGFAYVNKELAISPEITGGHQEYNLRAGTENVTNIVGMAKAIELLKALLPKASEHMTTLRDYFEKSLASKLSIKVNCETQRICNVSNLYLEGKEAERLLFHLDKHNIMVSHGSACASFALQPSKVLKAMGYPKERVLCSLRFSFNRNNTLDQVDKVIDALLK